MPELLHTGPMAWAPCSDELVVTGLCDSVTSITDRKQFQPCVV